MINRLDEDLSTLGQISKLSETLSFPHTVGQSEQTAAPHDWTASKLISSVPLSPWTR